METIFTVVDTEDSDTEISVTLDMEVTVWDSDWAIHSGEASVVTAWVLATADLASVVWVLVATEGAMEVVMAVDGDTKSKTPPYSYNIPNYCHPTA